MGVYGGDSMPMTLVGRWEKICISSNLVDWGIGAGIDGVEVTGELVAESSAPTTADVWSESRRERR